MPPPIAYLLTWTTYGTWLPGDKRGWVTSKDPGIADPDPIQESAARQRMNDPPVELDQGQRAIVAETIGSHCKIRTWPLHALNVRSNHVHVVVTAAGVLPDEVMNPFKAWCSRRLNEKEGGKRQHWWTKGGSTKWINDEDYLHNAIRYVLERQ